MKYIASCSFGKDSLATVIVALEHGEPLDEVLYCEVMFDEQTSGEGGLLLLYMADRLICGVSHARPPENTQHRNPSSL